MENDNVPQGKKIGAVLREQTNDLMAALQLVTPLVRESGGDKASRYLAIMNQSLYNIMRLVDHLEFASEEWDPVFQPQAVDLGELYGELCGKLGHLLGRAGVRFSWAEARGSLLTLADPALVEKAALNMLSNAARAAGEGGWVKAELRRTGELIGFTVRDSGAGLSDGADAQPLLAGDDGLGLGLAVARRVARLHGGSLVLDSEQGGGVRAVLTLPAREAPPQQVRSPRMSYDGDGGFSPVLLELAPVLPYEAFAPEDLE